jgi:UDP:flavonoid glycosyltransferase YjiC (YdhE family)
MDKLPDGFEAWLKAGDQPIYIGFGSIPMPDPVKFLGIITKILNTTSHRILFCIGWSVIAEIPQHKNLFVVSTINHDWVLPLCKVAIIHGGIGTTGAVIKAKIPVVIVSILADQPYNGKMVEQLKIGVHIPFKTVTTQKLLKAIALTQTEEYKRNAKVLGEKVDTEDGVAECVEIMEAYFN